MGQIQKARKIVPVPTLHFSDGPLVGHMLRLDHGIASLGRQENNAYVVPDSRVSRVHAQVRREPSVVIITDLGSRAGTTINGTTIDGPTLIRHGDRVGFGPVAASFEDPAATSERDDPTLVFDAPPEASTGPHLSPRQQQVLDLIAEGMTNSEIGRQLGVTERTIKAYAQELYDKLGVRNRAGAVAGAIRLDLLGRSGLQADHS